jgi:hypothetical protein
VPKHIRTYIGHRVRVKLIDGEVFVDRYVRGGNNYMVLESRGRVMYKLVKSMSLTGTSARGGK